jgi:DNA-binding transcriptional LysR family regulator
MVTTRQLRAFLAVAEAGSTVGAARALSLSQPSVSTAIRELEAALGQPVFHRLSARGLVPTSFGLAKLRQARALAVSLAAFERPGAEAALPAGHVAFGYFSTLGPQYVPGILALMARRHPQITLSPVEADLAGLNRLLAAGRIELALSYDVGIGARIRAERVAELQPYAVLPARHKLAKRASVTPTALGREPFILVDLPLSGEFLLSVLRAEGVEPRIAHRVQALEMVFGMVANGLGVSVLVTRRAGDQAYDGKRVALRPIAGTRVRQGVVLATPAWADLTAPGVALAACIREIVSKEAAAPAAAGIRGRGSDANRSGPRSRAHPLHPGRG